MEYLSINEQNLPYPSLFTLTKIPNTVCELTTMAGQKIADVNGWKYADTTIEWGTLYQEDLEKLLDATADPTFVVGFHDANGIYQELDAILVNFNKARSRVTSQGDIVWRNVSITVSFPDSYKYEDYNGVNIGSLVPSSALPEPAEGEYY